MSTESVFNRYIASVSRALISVRGRRSILRCHLECSTDTPLCPTLPYIHTDTHV